ncbi:Nop14-like protein [Auriscalpium vulgare]|uniref:Nop14-like protein n=1 Tax=Auriscalpium vulgare TaxID=40419 RepID=A0ACB8SC17_9AGAM|nr:Nop14-like protein [Auriscalpium vulgare]
MAKGSQLSQLRSALSNAGITKPSQPGKKRKRAQNEEKDKIKRAAKLQEIQQKLNPFDVKVTKLKHDVGGRKLKGITGKPTQSRQAGLEQRKKTLLKEYQEKDHAGGIVDRRFGENDPTLTPEERMLERFTKEKQRASKGIAFNLEDESELTHYGQSLSKLDDFDNVGLGLDEDEDEVVKGQIDGEAVKRGHFGGFGDEDDDGDDDEPERKKTKAEVMAEVMAKSKDHKLQRQIEREQDDDIRHQLDQELDSIRALLAKPDALSASLDNTQNNPLSKVATDHDLEYDQFVKELVFDKRAKPKDRTKTEEELALEEKESLEKAERKRLRRQNGEDDVDSEEDDLRPGKRRKVAGGDDLEDDFVDDEGDLNPLGTGLQEQSGEEDGDSNGDSDDDEEVDDVSEDGSGSEGAGALAASDSEELESSEGEDIEDIVELGQSKPVRASRDVPTELPFTFPCPSSHEEFLEIVDDIPDVDVPTVVQRIRALHHPSLAPDNKFKLQALSGVLVDHILHITSPPQPRFGLLTALIPHLYALTKAYPISSAGHFNQKLALMHKNLKRGLSRGAADPEAKTWPGLSELSLLRIVGAVWPTSDMNHAVVTPARLLMGSYLGLCRVRSLTDIASGLFLCSLFLEFEALSKRFVPEALNFVVNAVLHMAPHGFTSGAFLPGSFPSPDFNAALRLDAKASKKLAVNRLDLVSILSGEQDDSVQTKVDLLGLSMDLLSRFADMYKALDAFVDAFDPVLTVLLSVKSEKLAEGLQNRLTPLVNSLRRLLKFSRQARRPLRLQAHKPIPIPSYIPKFEANASNYLRSRDPDHERNEAAKLRKEYKDQRKGAIRELRKDARFLAGVEQQKQIEKDRAYNNSMKRVFGSIEGERAEEKAMDREKAKEKRRAGRK